MTKHEPNTVISRETLGALRADTLPLFETVIPKRAAAERMVSGGYVLLHCCGTVCLPFNPYVAYL